ncbi:hypothetical protein LRS10_20250 [Phenylobacterium sp. J426]|uniref:hypothetical protein n=1 Tax=Phenylobacterium sp. J426 TaxID=2898439 RepID=UPI002151E447|nr:hypothetical protein [Phenylobacterium sp. J426]MCR5876274.1 hypothetical protein [Phenylobacterium sp. J426]
MGVTFLDRTPHLRGKACALKASRPATAVVGGDIDPASLQLALANAAALGLELRLMDDCGAEA